MLPKHLIHLLNIDIAPNMKIQNLGSFLESVPARLGHNQALDDAVQCICTAYSCILSRKDSVVRQDRRQYYIALRSLRLSVLNEEEAISSNVLAAAVLLSWYEVTTQPLSQRNFLGLIVNVQILADNLDDGWLAHIRGCAQLIELRGPSRHLAKFDRELLYAQEGLIVSLVGSFENYL
jgi:hypothetical protein